MDYNIPLIDFSKCGLLVAEDEVTNDDLRNYGAELYAALSTAGFAYLTNHGIDWSTIDNLNEVAERFYSLPLEEKKKFERKSFELSYDAIGKSKANLEQVDYYEGFRAGGGAFSEDEISWPNVPGFKESYISFSEISGKLLLRIMKALGYGMKLKDVSYFSKAHSLINRKGNLTVLKTIKYPPIHDDDVATENRVGEHTDKDSLTLLFQDEMGGLQVRDASGEFVDVSPIPGAIVINVGDTLAAWSGNRLKATCHRVTAPSDPNKRGKVRRSVGYFGQGDSHVLMEKLVFEDGVEDEQSKEEGEKPNTVEEHVNMALGAIFSYKY